MSCHGPRQNRYAPARYTICPHHRKYIRNLGQYLEQEEPKTAELDFWGEWEPPSRVIRVQSPIPNGPRIICEPYLDVPREFPRGEWLNTDPFVFGGSFLYTLCQQRRFKGTRETSLRRLRVGSIVLFGSCIGESFCLDTLLVVQRSIDHDRHHPPISGLDVLSDHFLTATISPMYGRKISRDDLGKVIPLVKDNPRFRLYIGATFENQVDGMHSFFPCITSGSRPSGFARPRIQLPGVISDRKNQGYAIHQQDSPTKLFALWQCVKDQVVGQGLMLGVATDLPPMSCPA